MQGILRMSPDRTLWQAKVGETEFETTAWPEEELQLLKDPATNKVFAVSLDKAADGLRAYTIYELRPIETTCVNEDLEEEPGEDDLEDYDPGDDDDDDDEGDDDDDEGEPQA